MCRFKEERGYPGAATGIAKLRIARNQSRARGKEIAVVGALTLLPG